MPVLQDVLQNVLSDPLGSVSGGGSSSQTPQEILEGLVDLGASKLRGLWYEDGPNTKYSGSDTILETWTSIDAGAKVGNLHSTFFSGDDPRPILTASGVYFNSEAGFTVSDGLIPDALNFGFIWGIDFAKEQITEYATRALADADVGNKVDGDIARVTADTVTTYSPDFNEVLNGDYPDSNLVRGYYRRFLNTWNTTPENFEVWGIKGTGAEYMQLVFSRTGQLEFTVYAGSGGPVTLKAAGTDVLETSGIQILALFREGDFLRMYLNGKEVGSADVAALPSITTFNTTYFNGDDRNAATFSPVRGWRQYWKAFCALDNCSFAEFKRAHDAVAGYAGGSNLDIPAVAYGIAHYGQSWVVGSTNVTDTWRPTSGWDGEIDRANSTNSGDHLNPTREFLPRVRANRDSTDDNDDIGPLFAFTNSLGVVDSALSHVGNGQESIEYGLTKQIISHASENGSDWTIANGGVGGATLAFLSLETNPAWDLEDLVNQPASSLTPYEEMLQAIVFARDFHVARGSGYQVPVLIWQHGHSDTSTASYQADFLAFYDKFNTAVKTITGQTNDVICIFPQVNYSTDGKTNRGNVSTNIDQIFLDIVANRGSRPLYCAGPVYQITNYIHNYKAGHRWNGEIFGKVFAAIWFDSVDWKPLQPTNFTVGSGYVDIDFHVPSGAMQFVDTNDNNIDGRVTADGVDTYGFEVHQQDSNSTVTITIASPGVVTWTGHGFSNGQRVCLRTTGALPTGLEAGTVYYVMNATTNTFELSATSGGGAINTSGSQTGTHTAFALREITSVAITDNGASDGAGTIRISSPGISSGDSVHYTGALSRFGNLCDSDNSTSYYRDQDWTVALSGGSPTFKDGNLNDMRNWCVAFREVLAA